MVINDQRMAVFPTRMNLTLMKNRLKSGEKGHLLLKRKSDALMKRHRETITLLEGKRTDIKMIMQDALFSLAECEYLGANFNLYLPECKKSRCEIKLKVEQVSGVELKEFVLVNDTRTVTTLERAGTALNKCRKKFINVLRLLVELCSLQSSFEVLNSVLMSVNRRVNALEFLFIPRLNNTIEYINTELDEMDREEFFRLKKVQSLKKKDD